MDKEERRRYLTAEHKAYLSLIEKGYSPQGADDKFENIVVFKIENKNTNNEKRQIYYFKDWQEADEKLV